MELTRYLTIYTRPDQPGRVLLVATRRCAVLDLSEAAWRRICVDGPLTPHEHDTLTRLGVLVASREAEMDELRQYFTTINSTSCRLRLTVALTLECNLACPYCFEEPFRGNFIMSPDTADLLVGFISQRMAGGEDIVLDFYGGEALIRYDLLRSIAVRLREAASYHGVAFSFNLFSNGLLLTREVVEELLPLGLQTVRLTIDGPPDIHDAQRPLVGGGGSFTRILKNLREIHRLVPVDLGGELSS